MPTAVAAPVAAHMDDIKGFVLDEQRTITYKWLSSSLAVSADVAKRWVCPSAARFGAVGNCRRRLQLRCWRLTSIATRPGVAEIFTALLSGVPGQYCSAAAP